MAKKRSCRRTEAEDMIHSKAVKLRKMTDEQLVGYIDEQIKKAESSGGKSIGDFVKEISELRGIGRATVSKIRAYAVESGYMEEPV